MFHIDPNINAAVERQAERVRAVRAVEYSPVPERFAPHSAAEDNGLSQRARNGVAVALAASVPIVLIVATMVALMR
jgi:hypothetical protein